MTYEEKSNEELIETFKDACMNLPGSGAKGRTYYYEVEAELLERLGEENEE